MKFDISGFFGIPSRKFKVDENLTRMTGALHEFLATFVITSRSAFL
jgi:hypothetical protein